MLTRLGVGEIELTQKMRHNIPKVEKEKSQTGWCHEAIRRRAVSGFLLTVAVLLGLLLDSFQWDDFIIHGISQRTLVYPIEVHVRLLILRKNSPCTALFRSARLLILRKSPPTTTLVEVGMLDIDHQVIVWVLFKWIEMNDLRKT